ncbi:MAG: hypothetical protein FWB86_06360 [Treponema sp.]|nr:hypothetical protein [Treponema sp.]
MKRLFFFLILLPLFFTHKQSLQTLFAESLYSPTWGFYIDLPEGYDYTEGDGKDRFSFSNPQGLMFDLVVYNGRFNSLKDLASDITTRLSNRGDVDFFQYRDKQAMIMKLEFGNYDGWALAVELAGSASAKPMLLALSYGTAANKGMDLFHLSALDSISPTEAELRYPGPLLEYSFPRGNAKNTPLAVRGLTASIRENDAEASQVLIEREFAILHQYLNTPYLQAATIRYYRFIYRDSYDRILNAASVIANNLGANSVATDIQKREYAQRSLAFVQGFNYERDLSGSDFINLVTAITEGRGDCDTRAVLFAILLSRANIRSAIMLSHHYSHAMGLADIPGTGARFETNEDRWLVAETTAKINIGLIDQEQSDTRHWFAVLFD